MAIKVRFDAKASLGKDYELIDTLQSIQNTDDALVNKTKSLSNSIDKNNSDKSNAETTNSAVKITNN